jgi:hypothetical protein
MVKLKVMHDDISQARYLIVLMNGKIIPGMKEPETIK